MKKIIAWFIPSPVEGSGGHRTIIQHIKVLADNGFDCHVYVGKSPLYDNVDDAKSLLFKLFGEFQAKIFIGFELQEKCDLLFATAYFTAKYVLASEMAAKKAYFIQDFEACFCSMGDSYLEAEESYRSDFMGVTMGRWLGYTLRENYGTKTRHVDFCADIDTYKPLPNINKEKAVCCIFQPEKPRRCAYTALMALNHLKKLMPDVKVYLYGSKTPSKVPINPEFNNLELITINQCNELYNKCMAGLCISSSNPSRIPYEMMAAGLPVVDIYRENNMYDMPSSSVLLAESKPEIIAQKLFEILNDEDRLAKMSESGINFMQNRPLDVDLNQFVKIVESMLDGTFTGNNNFELMYK